MHVNGKTQVLVQVNFCLQAVLEEGSEIFCLGGWGFWLGGGGVNKYLVGKR